MQQSRAWSLFESIANVVIGVGVAFTMQLFFFWVYSIPVSLNTNLQLTFWFTIVSLVRSYVIRRLFEGFRK
jgi:hypothetical protein